MFPRELDTSFDRTSFKFFPGLRTGDGLHDASFTDAPRQRDTREQNQQTEDGQRPAEFDGYPSAGRQKDSGARWAKKNHETHCGYKNHVKVGLKSKLIIRSGTTPANVHDSQVSARLPGEHDQAVPAGSACHSGGCEQALLEISARDFLMRKATRNHPLDEAEKKTNHTISRMRVRVEHVFARVSQMSKSGPPSEN